MRSSAQRTVHHTIAVQLGLDASAIDDDMRLDRDLEMHALELAEVGLRLEYSAPDRGAFPFEMLDASMTVRDVVGVYRFWLTSDETDDDAPDTLRMDLPPASVRESRRDGRAGLTSGANRDR